MHIHRQDPNTLLPSPARLRAATATGTPPLSVIDASVGGLLVEADNPFDIGSVVHLQLSTPDGSLCGTFALRCLHTHRAVGRDQTPTHVSALVFVHPPDDRTRDVLSGLGHPVRARRPGDGRRHLRLASPTDD